MKAIDLKLVKNPYKIYVGQNILRDLGVHLNEMGMPSDVFVITSDPIWKLHGKALKTSLNHGGFKTKVFSVPDGEKSKSAKSACQLLEDIAQYDIFKKPFILAFGGGVIGDLAGYVAAVYKRGIPYIHVPTTLLAQVDSAIGGKVAIDLPVGKNLVGAFHQPKVVWSDISLLKTLDVKQLRNGMAEVIKYGIIYDQVFFTYLENNYQSALKSDENVLCNIVQKCSEIKSDVVLKDEFETKNIRTILNYGHTVGHAIEAAGKYKLYQHGEAIALGMRIAADISVQEKLISSKTAQRIETLIDNVGLPALISSKVAMSDVMDIMRHDKKFVGGQNRFVLVQKIGKVCVKDGISQSVIKKACQKFIN